MTQRESNKAQTPAQRKAAQRARLKAKGLVMVRLPETWVTPEQAKQIEFKTAQIIANVLGNKYDD